jgi:hypothetical protein
MKTQSMAASSSSVNITMIADAFEPEGVVVTALGIKKEKRLDMPLQQVSGEEVSDVKLQLRKLHFWKSCWFRY